VTEAPIHEQIENVRDPIDLAEHRLAALFGLTHDAARRAVSEVLDCFDASVDEHITRSHAALQQAGVDNEAIYAHIAVDLKRLRFRAPSLTSRQIRRRIYG
jgi:hypothetical protein